MDHRKKRGSSARDTPRPDFPSMRTLLLLPWLGLSVSSCVTSTTTVGAVETKGALLSVVPAERAWLVENEGSFLGSVVRFTGQGGSKEFFFMVRNPWDQDVGMIDHLGRSWKRVPHEEDAWLGTGTVLEGVQRILEAGERAHMVELDVSQLEARTRAERARQPGGSGG